MASTAKKLFVANLDNMERLVNGRILVEREPSINLGRHPSRDYVQDLLPERHQQSVEGRIDLVVQGVTLFLAISFHDQ